MDNKESQSLDSWAYERIKHLLVSDKKIDSEFNYPVGDIISVGRHIAPKEVIAISRDLEKSISIKDKAPL